MTLTLTFNHLRAMVITYSHTKFKVNGQSVLKIERKQTKGQKEANALSPSLMRSLITAVQWCKCRS